MSPYKESVSASITIPWILEPSTVNNKLKRREGSGSTERESKNLPVEPEPSRRFNLLFTVEGSGIQGSITKEMLKFMYSRKKQLVNKMCSHCLFPVINKSCYHLVTRLMRPTDSQQVVP